MESINIDLLQYADLLKTKKEESITYIQDVLRKKWLVITPEEHVRQLYLLFLTESLKIRKGRIAIERGFMINGLLKRFDIVVFDNKANPWIVIECKAPQIKISQAVFDQISTYNHILQAPYLLVSNGRHHYMCEMNLLKKSYKFITKLPPIDL